MLAAPRQIAFEAPPAVRGTLASLGRTEDVRLSPGRSRIAIACYATEAIAVGDIELGASPDGPTVAIGRLDVLRSPLLREPHGLDWRDDETLVVANRAGQVAVLRAASDRLELVSSIPTDAPGSVALRRAGADRHEVLVCCNWQSVVTSFELDGSGMLVGGTTRLRRRLDLPDGVAVGATGRWLAVSNHNTHSVLVFDSDTAGEDAEPVAVLRGVDYPHGLRFAADDRLLVVADAGAPYVQVFAAAGASWAVGAAYPAATIRVLDEPAFARGHSSPMEGGPKGLDLDAGTGVLLVTCEELPLGAFAVSEVLAQPERFGADPDGLLRHELAALSSAQAEREATAAIHAHLTALTATKAWRLTAPLRRLHATLAALKRRRARPPDVTPGVSPAASD